MPRPSHLTDEGDIYRKYLVDRGISQQQFANEIGVSDSYISKWANGVGGMTSKKIIRHFPIPLAIQILEYRASELQADADHLRTLLK